MRRLAKWTWATAALAMSAVIALGCGGNVVVDKGNSGGGGDGGGGGGSSKSCDEHADCPGGLCIFSTGLCGSACPSDGFTPCPEGEICTLCGTSSCPACKDCMAACVPVSGNLCDDHDDCADSSVCLYGAQSCAPECTDGGGCANPSLTCDGCATSSCSGCNDCVGACLELL